MEFSKNSGLVPSFERYIGKTIILMYSIEIGVGYFSCWDRRDCHKQRIM